MGAPYSKKIKNEKIVSNNLPVTKTYSLVMLGSTIAGKTTLINSLINNEFDESLYASTGLSHSDITIKINDNEIIKFDIWDTVGRIKYRTLHKILLKDSSMYIIAFDVRSEKEMNEISFFLNQIKEVEKDYKEKPIFLIGNKCEKNNKHPREISKEIAEDFASKNNLFYFEVSAKRIRTLQKTFYIMMNIADDILTKKKIYQK